MADDNKYEKIPKPMLPQVQQQVTDRIAALEKVIETQRATMEEALTGIKEQLEMGKEEFLTYLKTKDFWISAFDISASKDFTKNNWKGKNVLLFGSEGYGIKAKSLEKADFRFKVNINNKIESLNISNTVSVVCHHIFQSIK